MKLATRAEYIEAERRFETLTEAEIDELDRHIAEKMSDPVAVPIGLAEYPDELWSTLQIVAESPLMQAIARKATLLPVDVLEFVNEYMNVLYTVYDEQPAFVPDRDKLLAGFAKDLVTTDDWEREAVMKSFDSWQLARRAETLRRRRIMVLADKVAQVSSV